MGRLKDELEKLAGIDFFRLAKQEPRPRARIRFLALGHLQSGTPKNQVADMFRVSLTALRKWLLRFLADGIDGLREKAGNGRKRKLLPEREEEFRQQVEQLQKDREGGRVRGQDIQVLLKEKFCVDHALPSVYHVLDRCGLSWISSRSKHPKSDPAAQEEFKKNFKKK
jgi:transposase